jgi:hypothetical protein
MKPDPILINLGDCLGEDAFLVLELDEGATRISIGPGQSCTVELDDLRDALLLLEGRLIRAAERDEVEELAEPERVRAERSELREQMLETANQRILKLVEEIERLEQNGVHEAPDDEEP